MPTALILGASGQIGRAAALALHADGYALLLADRGTQPLLPDVAATGAQRVIVDRTEPATLAAAVGDGVDVLVDVIAFTETDGHQLLGLGDRLGQLVVISSGSVYADPAGNALDGVEDHPYPRFDGPILESNPLVPAGPQTYATRKVALEQVVLGQDAIPTAVLRPAAVHGPGERHAREWWVVKRALDARTHLLLAEGEHTFHTTSAGNLGELIRCAVAAKAHGAWNAVDAQALPTREVVRVVAAAAGWAPELVSVNDSPDDEVGSSPWSLPADLILDMGAAGRDLGYRAVTDYPTAVVDTVRWLQEAVGTRADWATILTGLVPYGAGLFNYAAEDAYLAAHPVTAQP